MPAEIKIAPSDHASLTLAWKQGDDPSYLRTREWIVTNGLGGYASGTVSGASRRRHHGMFVANLAAPWGRTMLLPFLEEQVESDGIRFGLGEVELPERNWQGDGARFLEAFKLDWQIPTWTFAAGIGRLEKRVFMPVGQNTTCVSYRWFGERPVRLHLRPFVSLRPHQLLDVPVPNWAVVVKDNRHEIHFGPDSPVLRLLLTPAPKQLMLEEKQIQQVLYETERSRGYDHIEELRSPGVFSVDVEPEQMLTLLISTEAWELLEIEAASLFESEKQRCQGLVKAAVKEAQSWPAARLVIAADQFLIVPGTRLEENVLAHASGNEARTVIAGYHWFTDWGRDTMVSLEGLTLVTGRHHEARWILRTFSRYIKDGLLPNHFPEGGREAIYNTADATLWYFHAVDRYNAWTKDRETLELLFPILQDVIQHHVKGTHFNIHVDAADGLLYAGAEGYQLTWMDAKVDGWVVTPRAGKPVEIQALWYNALRLMAVWAEELGARPAEYLDRAEKARESFNRRFWHEPGQHLLDVIDGPGGDDPTFRPNQIFPISLRFPVLDELRWKPVMEAVTTKLLTPYGLRTLERGHKDYKQNYEGDLRSRDAAYHQGTVWPWLIGHFLDAWRRTYPKEPNAEALLSGLIQHLSDAGIGTISEIFDAEPPYTPRGCIAQAWSVAEMLRALVPSRPA